MDWYKIFYLFSLADKISTTTLTLAIICTLIAFISFMIYWASRMEDYKHEDLGISWGFLKMSWIPMLVFWLLWTFIPDRQDMTLIVAGGAVGQFIVNDENARALPADITRFLRKEILEATADISDELKEDLGIKTKKDSLLEMSKEELIKMLE